MSGLISGPLLIVGGVVALLLLIGIVIAKQYKVATPTEAIIVTGRAKPNARNNTAPTSASDTVELAEKRGTVEAQLTQKVVIGGSVFVIPLIQRFQRISLESQQVEVSVQQVPSKDGILLDVAGVVTVKVNGSAESVRAAAQRFGDNHAKIAEQAKDNMSGTLRAIIGSMEVLDILNDRQKFATQVLESIGDVIEQQGLHLDSFQINDVNDRDNYIKDLGRPKAAETRRAAVVAESNAQRDSETRRLENERSLSDTSREVEMQKAENQKAIDKAAAEAEAARPLEEAKQKRIRVQAEQEVEAENAVLSQRRYEATVNKEADAELYRAQRSAEAKERQAQADATAIQLEGEAQAAAEAATIREKGAAEAESLSKLLDAYKDKWTDAAAFEAQLKILPQIAKEIAEGYSRIGNITMITPDGTGKVTDEIVGGIASVGGLLQGFLKDGGGVGSFGDIVGNNKATEPAKQVVTSETALKDDLQGVPTQG